MMYISRNIGNTASLHELCLSLEWNAIFRLNSMGSLGFSITTTLLIVRTVFAMKCPRSSNTTLTIKVQCNF